MSAGHRPALIPHYPTKGRLVFRKPWVGLYFLNLLRVAFAVRGKQQDPLIAIERSKYRMWSKMVAEIVVTGADVVHSGLAAIFEGLYQFLAGRPATGWF